MPSLSENNYNAETQFETFENTTIKVAARYEEIPSKGSPVNSTVQLAESSTPQPKTTSKPVTLSPAIQKYEENKNQPPKIYMENFDSGFNFEYSSRKSCDSTNEIIIFKTARVNFDRRNKVRQHLKQIGLATNYFFMTGQKSSSETIPETDHYKGNGSSDI